MNYRIKLFEWNSGGFMVHSLEFDQGEIISGEDAVWETIVDAYSAARRIAWAVIDGLQRECSTRPNGPEGLVVARTESSASEGIKYTIEARQRDGEVARVCSIEIDGLLISAHGVLSAATLDLALENGIRFALAHVGKAD